MIMSFLPTDYKEPVTDKYMKLTEGENTFRIMSSAIVGYEYWKEITKSDGTRGRTPIRKRLNEKIDMNDLEVKEDGTLDTPKVFWAFVVYNWDADAIQILEITQASIRKAIKALVDNKKWGDQSQYNICISRTGKGKETEYQTNPEPKEEMPQEITDQYKSMTIDLEQLFSGGDPFALANEDKDFDDVLDIK
jgi:hypothetical protein